MVIALKFSRAVPIKFMDGDLIIKKRLHPINDFRLIANQGSNLIIL